MALLVLAVGVTLVLRQAPTAAATGHESSNARHAVGVTLRGQWFGSWSTSGMRGFCVDFDRSDPNSSGNSRLNGLVPGMSTEDSARVKYVVNTYGNTRDSTTAAAVAIFVWKTQKTARFDTYYSKLLKAHAVPAKIRQRERQIAAESRMHGPFSLAVRQTGAMAGTRYTGTVSAFTKHTRKPLTNALVRLALGNATLLSRTARTDRHGTVTFTARVNGDGVVTSTATLDMPSSTASWISSPSAGHQRLVLAGKAREKSVGSARSIMALGQPTLLNACSGDCKGAAPVSITMKNTSGMRVRGVVYSNGQPKASFFVAPGRVATNQYKMADEAKITTKWCYVNASGACLSALRAAGAALVVECPAWVEYEYRGTCPCDPGKNLSYHVWLAPGTTRKYAVTLLLTPKTGPVQRQTIALTGGKSFDFTSVRFASGTRVTLSFAVLGKTHVLDDLTQNV